MARLERHRHIVFARIKTAEDVEKNNAFEDWEAIGKDTDDLSKELNPQTENSKNVLGESTFTMSGYEPTVEVGTYYADPNRKISKHITECAIEEKYSEGDLLGMYAEAYFDQVIEDEKKMKGYCIIRDAWFVPQSIGGDTNGLSTPFNINPVGAMSGKVSIEYDMTTNIAKTTSDPYSPV